MIKTLNVGKYQLKLALNRKPGRPKKTIWQKIWEYIRGLKRLAKDRRYTNHPLSRVLRRIFENKKIKQVLGFNLLATVVLTSTLSPSFSAPLANQEGEITKISPQIVELTTKNSVRFPVESPKITQGYHRFHPAIDFAEPLGSPVYPIMDGRVETVVFDRFGWGNHLIIDHGGGFKSLYAHFSKIIVKKGQEVDKNTVIGLVGATGWATGPHLHLEVSYNGERFNPLTLLK